MAGVALAAGGWRDVVAREARRVEAVERIRDAFPGWADAVLSEAARRGASFADGRMVRMDHESVGARELMVQDVSASGSMGVSVRVLVDGAWGFAASPEVSVAGAKALVGDAVELAQAQVGWQQAPVEIESLPAYTDRWVMPVEEDPFAVPMPERAETLLTINGTALAAGANFCRSWIRQVREHKWLANSFGSRIEQTRTRLFPGFNVTVLGRGGDGFASRASLAQPIGRGYEAVRGYDFEAEARLAVDQAREKLQAPSVTPGPRDLVIHPTNLWLTIHESIGHPTELDRALGYEANFAGTSFCTPDGLDRLRYASERVTVRADRTQAHGLATVAYDDDGVKTSGREFNIIDRGMFRNYQMALGQAARIGRRMSNGCAYADSYASVPMQRMPNISLVPGEDPSVTVDDLIAGVDDGIYIQGSGSWSIDQQRYNFQFTGQVFFRIRNGKLDGMFRDVAYQGNSVSFWNACDGLGGAASYELGGAFNCGKGRPTQLAPVSHGAVPARFRGINVLNTAEQGGDTVARTTPSARRGRSVWS